MSSGRLSRNNALAGLFVLACIGLFVLVLVLLSGAGERIKSTSAYIIDFSLADGADGLERGSVVKLGGKRVGRVSGSDFIFHPSDPSYVIGVEVRIDVRSDLQLYEDADVNIMRPLLGTNSTINFSSLGNGPGNGSASGTGSKPILPGSRIRGKLGPPGFLTQADYARFQNVLARVDKWSLEIDPHIKPIAQNVETTVINARDLTDRANASWDRWNTEIDSVLAMVRKAMEPVESITLNVKDGVQEVREFVRKGDELIARNRPQIDGAIDDARSLLKKAQGEAYDKVIAMLDTAQEGLAHAANVARDADRLVTTKGPELEEIVTSAALAAQELKLATAEIRAAPWRLLYQPNKKELENELLYNSIRQYSHALGEVRAAAGALEAATRNVATTPNSTALTSRDIETLAAKLRATLDKSEEQEKAFFDRWVKGK